MRNRYFFFLFAILVFLKGEVLYPQQQGNWVQNFNGIPVHTGIDWDWVSYKAGLGDTLIQAMQHMGIDFIQSNVKSEAFMQTLRDPSGLNMKVIPIASFDKNWVEYYTDTKYTAWKAGVTDTNYLRHDTSAADIVSDGGGNSYVKLRSTKSQDTVNLLWGPFYFQESKYYTLEPGHTTTAPVQYNCDFQLKLELNPDDNSAENPNDTICILRVTSSRLDTPNTWTFGCTQVIDSIIVKRVQFDQLNQFQKFHFLEPYTLNIADCPLPPHPHSDSYIRTYNANGIEDIQFRAGKDYMQYQVQWLGKHRYLLSIDSIIVQDLRFNDFNNGTAVSNINIQLSTLNSYPDVVVGWLGLDEPLSIDSFEPIKRVQQIVNNHSPNLGPVWFPLMGHWDGVWNNKFDPFGTYHLSPWDEMHNRIGNMTIWQDDYLYDMPYKTYFGGSDTACNCLDFRAKNIDIAAEINHKQAYNLDHNFGVSLQCGEIHNDQADQRNINANELLYSANLALLYGAKFFSLYTYFAQADVGSSTIYTTHGIVDSYQGALSYTDKYFMFRDTLNPRLKGLFGQTIKKLIPIDQYVGTNGINLNFYVPYMRGSNYTTENYYPNYVDYAFPVESTLPCHYYIDYGNFRDTTNESTRKYFMIINRYYSEFIHHLIGLKTLNGYTNWNLTNYSDTVSFTLQASGDGKASFIDTLYYGDAGLYSVMPVVKYGGDIKYNETISGTNTLSGELSIKLHDTLTLSANSTYNITKNITIDSGAVFVINQGATLNIQNGASLIVRGNLVIGTNAILNIASGDSIDVYGHVVCETNLNIPVGSKLKLHNGSGLNMNYDDTLYINGTLTTGIQSGTSTINGGSIIFEGSSSSGSVLKNVNWNNGTSIQCLEDADITIVDCNIIAPGEEIYVYLSSPKIIHNLISEPLQCGIIYNIAGSYNNPISIYSNTVFKTPNTLPYAGIWIYDCDGPRLSKNFVNGFHAGIYIAGISDVYFLDTIGITPYPNNLITNNDNGLFAEYSSMVWAGSPFDEIGMYNSIHNNINNVVALYSSYIEAGWNYWGGGHNEWIDGTSTVEFYDDLTEDPWEENLIAVNPPNNNPKVNQLNKSNGSDSSMVNNISAGLLLEKQDRISDAILFYKGLIQKDKYVPFALKQLAKIKAKYSRSEISTYFDDLLTNNKYYTVVEKLIGDTYLKNNQFDNAITAYDNVIKNNATSYDGISAKFEKLFAYLHIKKDLTKASKILSEIKEINSKDEEVQMRINIAERLIYGTTKGMKKNANTVKVNIPRTYELYQNYPNPFNPVTTIKYQIPKPGMVTLKVYDILGREVATLVNENKIEGAYDFTFDASKYSSGAYIYQLRVNDYVSSKKLILLK